MYTKLFFLFFFSLNIFANGFLVDSLTLSKIKKTVEKEEEIALVYKKFLLNEGNVPTIDSLKTKNYLPESFSKINPFGREMSISDTEEHSINNPLPENLKENLYDYYYSNKYRNITKEPLYKNSNNVEIILSTKEKFIYDNTSDITTTTPSANKYYLDKGVLHYYDNRTIYKFSYADDLIVDKDFTILNSDGTFNSTFNTLTSKVRYAGQKILQEKNGVAEDYLVIGNGAIALNEASTKYGSTVVQFSRRAGGMIVNGDIYAWGNNANRITGIDDGSDSGTDRYPVINTLVRLKTQVIDDDHTNDTEVGEIDLDLVNNTSGNKNYFSSPIRPKFIDFFGTVFYGTCGITTKGELYCGGSTGADFTFGNNFTHTLNENKSDSREMLYRSRFFDGKANSPKAKKIFANNQIWHILSTDGDIYRWGYDWSGFSGNGALTFNDEKLVCKWVNWVYRCSYERDTTKEPEKISITNNGAKETFTDISYLLTLGHRKIGALSTNGDIYIWGEEKYNSNGYCNVKWEDITFNLCSPTKIDTLTSNLTENITFKSIRGGLQAFVATDTLGNYYKIYQPKGKKIQVQAITNDTNIKSLDFSSTISELSSGDKSKTTTGIVWVNGDNELKGDYHSLSNNNDELFDNIIKYIKWKQIKVIEDDNGMCGIDINNQMYCWGIMSFYRNIKDINNVKTTISDNAGNTFMMPIFNSNLYDLDKDFMVVEGGKDGYLTNMTSDEWETTNSDGKSGAFFMKYPTYIGGFNYDFEFK
jgi:hypothetical protein